MKKDRDLPSVTQTPRAPIHANIQFNKKNNITAYEWRSKIILIIQLNYTSHQHNIRNALLQTGLHDTYISNSAECYEDKPSAYCRATNTIRVKSVIYIRPEWKNLLNV